MCDQRVIARMVDRATGQVVEEFDLTGYPMQKLERWWDGLLFKVDFERFYVEPSDLELLANTGGGS